MHVAGEVERSGGVKSHRYVVMRIPADLARQHGFLTYLLLKPAPGHDHLVLVVVVRHVLILATSQQREAYGKPRRHLVNLHAVLNAPLGSLFDRLVPGLERRAESEYRCQRNSEMFHSYPQTSALHVMYVA